MPRLKASNKSKPLNLFKSTGWVWTSKANKKIWKSHWKSKGFPNSFNNLSSTLSTKIAPLAASKRLWRIITLPSNTKALRRSAKNYKTKDWPQQSITRKSYSPSRKRTKNIDLKSSTPLPSQMLPQTRKEVLLSMTSSSETSKRIQQ